MASTLTIAERLLLINSQEESFEALGLRGERTGGRGNAEEKGNKVSCED